ncbi:MAG: flagellar export chaperone FliS [Treponema sp.]|jgi:flagellar protein FliS|nr:flagellar export chaperone FliS [Treponema sp.]
MGYKQAYSAYRETSVKTASQGQLIVMLYEEAIRQLTAAKAHFSSDGKIPAAAIEKFNANIVKTQEIITELQVSLNMEQGGSIAQNLMSLYVYFNSELMEANISHNKDKISFVLDMMTQLGDSWRTAAASTAVRPAAPAETPALNIEG